MSQGIGTCSMHGLLGAVLKVFEQLHRRSLLCVCVWWYCPQVLCDLVEAIRRLESSHRPAWLDGALSRCMGSKPTAPASTPAGGSQ